MVQSGTTTNLYGTVYDISATGVSDLEIIADGVTASEHTADKSVVFRDEEFAVTTADGERSRIFNNRKAFEETANGYMIFEDYTSLKASFVDGTLTLSKKNSADLNLVITFTEHYPFSIK